LTMGLSEGCRIIKPVTKDSVITYDDVDVPKGRLIDQLIVEQQNLN
jgi:predicted homoserine dehydrogenase-like protein